MNTRPLLVEFLNIPTATSFTLFGGNNRDDRLDSVHADPGDSRFDVEVPVGWSAPSIDIRTAGGYAIPVATKRQALSASQSKLQITGDDYFADVDRAVTENEINHTEILSLVTGASSLNGRQRFYVALVALQSHFEYLTYNMLVLSGCMSRSKWKKLNHETEIGEAFDSSNSAFFGDPIAMPGRQPVAMGPINDETRESIREVFDMVRKLRNDVVHGWTYKARDRTELQTRFASVNEQIRIANDNDDDFYNEVAFILVRLFARAGPVSGRASVFRERSIVVAEREDRGYKTVF